MSQSPIPYQSQERNIQYRHQANNKYLRYYANIIFSISKSCSFVINSNSFTPVAHVTLDDNLLGYLATPAFPAQLKPINCAFSLLQSVTLGERKSPKTYPSP